MHHDLLIVVSPSCCKNKTAIFWPFRKPRIYHSPRASQGEPPLLRCRGNNAAWGVLKQAGGRHVVVVLALVRRPDAAVDRCDDYRRSIVRQAQRLEVGKACLDPGMPLDEGSSRLQARRTGLQECRTAAADGRRADRS
jgi:hypothetical protein